MHTLVLSAGLGAWEYSAHIFFGVSPNILWVILFSLSVSLLYHLDHFRDLLKLKNKGVYFHSHWKWMYFLFIILFFCGIGFVLLVSIPQKMEINLKAVKWLWLLPGGLFTILYFLIAMNAAFHVSWSKEWLIALAVTCTIYGIPLATADVKIQTSLLYPLVSGLAICISNIIAINSYELKYDEYYGFYNGLIHLKNPLKLSRKIAVMALVVCVICFGISTFNAQSMSIVFMIIALHLFVITMTNKLFIKQWQYRIAIDGCFLWFLLRLFL